LSAQVLRAAEEQHGVVMGSCAKPWQIPHCLDTSQDTLSTSAMLAIVNRRDTFSTGDKALIQDYHGVYDIIFLL